MDRNTILVVLTTLVGTAVLSGCTAAASPGSAMDVQPPADRVASQWASDAELVTIVGMEGAWDGGAPGYVTHGAWGGETAGGRPYSMSSQARSDPRVGDGACAMWVFRYVSESQGLALDVVVSGNGTVVATETDSIDGDDVPLGAYQVNSDQAVRTARAESPAMEQAVQQGVLLVLDRDDAAENPLWIVMAGQGGFVIVDAVTGDVLFAMDDDWDGAYGGYGGRWGHDPGGPGRRVPVGGGPIRSP